MRSSDDIRLLAVVHLVTNDDYVLRYYSSTDWQLVNANQPNETLCERDAERGECEQHPLLPKKEFGTSCREVAAPRSLRRYFLVQWDSDLEIVRECGPPDTGPDATRQLGPVCLRECTSRLAQSLPPHGQKSQP